MEDYVPLSVIVCARNAEKTIGSCLESIMKNSPAEIILVDGDSTDKTVSLAAAFTQHILNDRGRGTSFAHQIGSEIAGYDYIMFVDADVELPPYALGQMFAELKKAKLDGIYARTEGAGQGNFWERAATDFLSCRPNPAGIWFGAALVSRDIVLKYGFDSFISPGDDVDFNRRALSGGCVFGVSAVRVKHHHRTTFKNVVHQYIWYGKGNSRLAWKNGLLILRFWPPFPAVYGLLYSLGHFKFRPVSLHLLAFVFQSWGMVCGLTELIFNPPPDRPRRPCWKCGI
ncbi:glycosyltransferase family 2 protein [Dehalococcoides sp.]|uniref:glycosyltransferase n=1 Tax=Dehalococcoides sp. TaxID=1966486 RepID=UPI003562DED5